jgi:Predicted Zn-dependent hydrolases of the beta-lactamase fold
MGELTWLGHAAVLIKLKDKSILIDPMIKGNPKFPIRLEDLREVNIVCVSHDHYDHLGDSIEILHKIKNAKMFASFDLSQWLAQEYKVDQSRFIPANIGGFINEDEVRLALTPAVHSSSHSDPNGIIVSDGEITIYHAGDTWVFGDMKLIGEIYKPTYALLPIGGRFTMNPKDAVYALELIRPKVAIPIHYNTWDLIKVNENEFKELAAKKGFDVRILKPGESIKL